MAVLVAKYGGFVEPGACENERRSREKNKLLSSQSRRGFSALAHLCYLANKTAMLRRLERESSFRSVMPTKKCIKAYPLK